MADFPAYVGSLGSEDRYTRERLLTSETRVHMENKAASHLLNDKF